MGAKQRLRKWLDKNDIGIREFCRKIDVSSSFLGSGENVGSDALDKIMSNYPNIDIIWVITGQKNEQNNIHLPKITSQAHKSLYGTRTMPAYYKNDQEIQQFKLRTDAVVDNQSVPLYDIEAVAGLEPIFSAVAESIPMDFITIPNLPKCDGAIHIKGDSMYPLLKSGDIVLYKELQDIENDIFFGEMYLLSLDVGGEEYITVKFVQRADKEGYITLVSQNEHHQPKVVNISKIRALALVKASIRINSMN